MNHLEHPNVASRDWERIDRLNFRNAWVEGLSQEYKARQTTNAKNKRFASVDRENAVSMDLKGLGIRF